MQLNLCVVQKKNIFYADKETRIAHGKKLGKKVPFSPLLLFYNLFVCLLYSSTKNLLPVLPFVGTMITFLLKYIV